jgi:hypothetical protein
MTGLRFGVVRVCQCVVCKTTTHDTRHRVLGVARTGRHTTHDTFQRHLAPIRGGRVSVFSGLLTHGAGISPYTRFLQEGCSWR